MHSRRHPPNHWSARPPARAGAKEARRICISPESHSPAAPCCEAWALRCHCRCWMRWCPPPRRWPQRPQPRVTRMGFIYFPHGAVMDRWSPKQAGTRFHDLTDPEAAGALPFADDDRQRSAQQGRRERGSARHHGRYLAVAAWVRPVGDASSDRGVTADQLAARHIGQDTPLPSLEISWRGRCNGLWHRLYRLRVRRYPAFRTPTQPLPMENNPRKVFYQMFGKGDTIGGARGDSRRQRQRPGLRDGVHGAVEVTAGRGGSRPSGRLHGFGARSRAARTEAQREQQVGPAAAQCAAGHSGGLYRDARRAFRADGAGVSVEPDACRLLT